jgi:hypothetical protein
VTLKPYYYHKDFAYVNGLSIFAGGLGVVTLGTCPTINNISFKGGGGRWWNKCLGFKTRVASSRGPRDFAILDRVTYWGLWAMAPLLIIPWLLPYDWGKSRNTSVRIVGKMLGRVCSVDPVALLRTVMPAPLISSLFRLRYREVVACDFGQPPVGTINFHVAELRKSLHQITLTRNSQSVLWCKILVHLLVANVPLVR